MEGSLGGSQPSIGNPRAVPRSVLVRVLADLLEDRATPAVHITAVLLAVDPVVLPHSIALGLDRPGQI